MSLLLVSGVLIGVVAASLPLLLRLSGVGWLPLAAVPVSTVLFAISFTLAGNGPLLSPLSAGVAALHGRVAMGSHSTHAAMAQAAQPRPALDLNGPRLMGDRGAFFRLELSPGRGRQWSGARVTFVGPDGAAVTSTAWSPGTRARGPNSRRTVKGAF